MKVNDEQTLRVTAGKLDRFAHTAIWGRMADRQAHLVCPDCYEARTVCREPYGRCESPPGCCALDRGDVALGSMSAETISRAAFAAVAASASTRLVRALHHGPQGRALDSDRKTAPSLFGDGLAACAGRGLQQPRVMAAGRRVLCLTRPGLAHREARGSYRDA